jgi:uncharacterized protein YbjT (DUF2867 family)
VLLTGATGFVGQYLYPALIAGGAEVRCATRNVEAAQRRHPDRHWVELDVEHADSIHAAINGCSHAYYLIHGMGHGSDYPQREAQSAENFLAAAEKAGTRRIIYLGGVLPATSRPSKHLASRQRTGEILRSGSVQAIELRAAMIVGEGSASWTMVRDLAARLPAMILPRWLRNHSYPVSIDDVVWALVHSLHLVEDSSKIFEVPGPERISHRDVLRRVAAVLGHTRPMMNVPILSPRLSSYWIALVTRVGLDLAKELVEGVRYDLEPQCEVLWQCAAHSPMLLETAARLAITDSAEKSVPSQGAIERMRLLGSRFMKEAA